MARKSKFRPKRHAFRLKTPNGKVRADWAKVIPGKRDVYLLLKAEHVRESIQQKGVGNTQTCSMAVCAQRQAEAFPHPVTGTIDWFYSRAYVVSRENKAGIPTECYEYAHSDEIAKLNDTRGGQQKLLAELEAAGGERIIHLRPWNPRKIQRGSGKPEGRRDGSRTRTRTMPRGARLRAAVAAAGGV